MSTDINKTLVEDKYAVFQQYYSTHFGEYHKESTSELKTLMKYFHRNYGKLLPKNNDAAMMEIGCGSGYFLSFLKKEGYQNIWGIDVSPECVEICKRIEGIQPARIGLEDAISFLKKAPTKFDCIVMNDVIEHLPKNEIVETLTLVRTQLKPGGKVIIKTPNMANPITAAAGRYIDITHTVGFTEESMAQVLRMAGFKQFNIIAQDIWVFNPILNFIGKSVHRFMEYFFRLLFLGYGRGSTRIFSKDLIAYASATL